MLPIFALAAENTASSGNPPGGVADTLKQALQSIWVDFIYHTPYLLAGLIALIATAIAASLTGRFARKLARQARLRGSLQDLIQRLASIGAWFLGLLLTAMLVFPGLTPTRALGGLGILSIAVGLAFRDMFENFFAGILLLWKFPFENGDYIQCQELEGQVEKITTRMTLLRQVTGELILVPNAFLFKHPVYVLTNRKRRRANLIVGIAYGENVDDALPVIETALADCDTVDQAMPTEIFMKEFASSSVDIEVAWWTDSSPVGLRRSRNEVVAAIKRALDKSGIEIPFPYRMLVHKNPLRMETINREEE